MVMDKHIFTFLFIIYACALQAQSSDGLIIKAQQRYPTLEVCQLPGFSEKTLCGQLMVYENHNTDQGKQIPIDVIVLPATTENPGKSAFTLHWGGNGSPASDKIWYFSQGSSAHKIREARDIVLIDDRGTGASNIRCAAMDSLTPYSYAFVYDEQLIKDCLKEVKGIVNLDLYNTQAVVQDYDTVRKWLGLEQFDFYGISYGVRVGLEYMRQFTDKLRTLTVQGCVPPGFNYINEMDVMIQEQLEILFKRCEDDTTCNKYYPNFQKELYAVRDLLKKTPAKFDYILDNGKSVPVTIDDLIFRRMVGHQILNGDANEALPLLVHRAYGGNFVPLILAGGSATLDMPVFLSQFCPEEIDRFSFQPEAFNAKDLFTQGVIGQEKVSACNWWQQMPEANWLESLLKSKNPILILTGEYDANTPVKMGEQIWEAFPETSRHIILPHQGHAGTSDRICRFDIIAQFVETKKLENLDTTCLKEIQPTSFAYEEPLSIEAFKKYAGNYVNEDPGKTLQISEKQGVYFLHDEYSRFSGPSQLLFKGGHSFDLLDCSVCKIDFTMDGDEVKEVKRTYRETISFTPKKP